MLFNSFEFILLFLPITIFLFFRFGKLENTRLPIIWLVSASLFFYGWWNPAYVSLILASILFNYAIGILLSSTYILVNKKIVLIIGLSVNLAALGYFKYANFFISNLNTLFNTNISLANIVLPLAISFFTFQQITYIVDAYQGKTKEYNFLHYCLFVTFFPQLIAGPIVHHREMLPQFAKNFIYKINYRHLTAGITIFFIGLFKKTVLADSASAYSTPVFDAAEDGVSLTLYEAWGGALAYTFQLYFDFSGYSDMAIGIARMFGIRLPINFNSPYKSRSIIDFWRRWHITLSRFLRDYVYIPLGGNRKGKYRRLLNLMITMFLGGLWHGAGWTFIVWGTLHGLFLIINHLWASVVQFFSIEKYRGNLIYKIFSHTLTFLCVVVAWVFFRAESMAGSFEILGAMLGLNGFTLSEMPGNDLVNSWSDGFQMICVLYVLALFAPNTQQIMILYMRNRKIYFNNIPHHFRILTWKPSVFWLCLTLILSLFTMHSLIGSVSEFLYFQF